MIYKNGKKIYFNSATYFPGGYIYEKINDDALIKEVAMEDLDDEYEITKKDNAE